MPKMKTKSGAAKRFSVTGSGKIKFKRKGLQHILTKRTRKSKRNARRPGFIQSCDTNLVQKCIPYGA